MAIELELLGTACYFTRIEASTLKFISGFVSEMHVPAGKVIFWEGESEGTIYFVISGLVKLFTSSVEGREFIPRMVYGGDSFNDEKILNSEPNALSASSMTPALLYHIHQEDLYGIMQAYSQVSSNITKVLATRQRYFIRLTMELVFKKVTSRLARLLLEKEMSVHAGVVMPKITQYDMASMIGTVREIVSRALKDLESSGAIRIQHNEIVILDRDKLSDLSKSVNSHRMYCDNRHRPR